MGGVNYFEGIDFGGTSLTKTSSGGEEICYGEAWASLENTLSILEASTAVTT